MEQKFVLKPGETTRSSAAVLRENARICADYFWRKNVPVSGGRLSICPSSDNIIIENNEDDMPMVRRTSQLPFDADPRKCLDLMRTAAEICVAHGRSEECPWKCVQKYNEFMQRRAPIQSQRLAARRVATWWFMLSASNEQLEQRAVASGENYQTLIELQAFK